MVLKGSCILCSLVCLLEALIASSLYNQYADVFIYDSVFSAIDDISHFGIQQNEDLVSVVPFRESARLSSHRVTLSDRVYRFFSTACTPAYTITRRFLHLSGLQSHSIVQAFHHTEMELRERFCLRSNLAEVIYSLDHMA